MIDLSILPVKVSGQKVAVLGAGRSGIAAALLLAQNGADVLLSDAAKIDIPAQNLKKLQESNIVVETGYHSDRILASDLVVISPGIPGNAAVVKKIETAKIPIVSEIETAFWFMPEAQLIAVTGSNGKTTTTSLLYEIFKGSKFKTFCGGNIGIPFASLIADSLQDSDKPKMFILEISSFQLERIVHFHPNVAIILNVTDDHMDRYNHDIRLYLQAKLKICQNQDMKDLYIYFDDDTLLKNNLPTHVQKRPFGFSKNPQMQFKTTTESITKNGRPYIDRNDIALLGEHNVLNIMAALNTADFYNVPKQHVVEVLKAFKGIEHRLEFVRTLEGVDYYNDSKATNVESVKYALKSFNRPIVIILGGRDKDSDFTLLLPELKKHVKRAILIGEASLKIEKVIDGIIDFSRADSLENAVAIARKSSKTGDIVLLAPACASFDMFDNYEHRGKVFKEIVNSLTGTKE